jgi:hypothetical protein
MAEVPSAFLSCESEGTFLPRLPSLHSCPAAHFAARVLQTVLLPMPALPSMSTCFLLCHADFPPECELTTAWS